MAFFGKDITAADLAAGRLQGSEKEKSDFHKAIRYGVDQPTENFATPLRAMGFKDAEKFTNTKPSFVFTVDNQLFERDLDNEENFISTYYLEYNDPDAISDVANTIVKKDKIRQAGFAHLNLFCANTPKFVFPHTEKIVILEVSDERSPQSINQYCQKMRQDISRKGVVMNNFVSISLLEKLK